MQSSGANLEEVSGLGSIRGGRGLGDFEHGQCKVVRGIVEAVGGRW